MPEQLWLSRVGFRYPGAHLNALTDVEVVADPGRRISVMGPLGSGRSTLVQTMCGVIPGLSGGELSGRVSYGEADLADHPVSVISEYIALVLQNPESQLLSRTVADDIALGPRNHGLEAELVRQRVRAGLAAVGLTGFEERLTSELSGGEAQRLAIAGVLAMAPEVLCLDQATARLDPRGAQAIEKVCRDLVEQGCCVVSVDDDPRIAAGADELWVMRAGAVVEVVAPLTILTDADACQQRGLRPLPAAELLAEVGKRCPTAMPPTGAVEAEEIIAWVPGFDAEYLPDPGAEPPGGEAVAVFEDVEFCYPDTPRILDGINLEIRSGELLGVVGPNGVGKSTLVRMLNGLLRPTSGRILVDGTDISRLSTRQLARKVGFCFQIPARQLFNTRVDKEIGYGLRNQGVPRSEIAERVGEVMARLGIEQWAAHNPMTLDPAQQQLVVLASGLVDSPGILVVDEPTVAQDWPGTTRIMEVLGAERDRGVAVVMISHDEELLGWHADRIIRLGDGRIIEDGTPGRVLDTLAARVWRGLFPVAEPASDSTIVATRIAELVGGRG